MSRKIKILMLGSLFLNILLIGASIGHISHSLGRNHWGRKPGPEFTVQLPKDKEKLFFETMEKARLENKEIYRQIRETREKAIAILTAPEFDEAAYQREVEKLHELRGQMKQRFANATIELAKQFNQTERKALAEYLRHPPPPPSGARFNSPPSEVSLPR
ncbi:MAG TPA: periplasmic heavy metal sensor [Candidatus Limnocylindrales bacterium]|nr:periplasmic heavy metal sensor [Candidatus Limnocylindrales bacterium]